jgi:signal transduction histidine kinase
MVEEHLALGLELGGGAEHRHHRVCVVAMNEAADRHDGAIDDGIEEVRSARIRRSTLVDEGLLCDPPERLADPDLAFSLLPRPQPCQRVLGRRTDAVWYGNVGGAVMNSALQPAMTSSVAMTRGTSETVAPEGRGPRRPCSLPRVALWVVVVIVSHLAALLLLVQGVLDDIAAQHIGTTFTRLIGELAGAYAALVLLPAVAYLARAFPIRRGRLARAACAHGLGLLAYSAVHTTLLAFTHGALFPWFGLAPAISFVKGFELRALQELAHDVVGYTAFLGVLSLWNALERSRDRELRASDLERALAQAELRTLRLQLQPHFLFNALNTIADSVHDDPRAADKMIADLAELLRISLRTPGTQEVPLSEELEILEKYLDLLRARFGDHLRVEMDVDPKAAGKLVPCLLLQPLVENVLRHGDRQGMLTVVIRAKCRDGWLDLQIADDGRGASAANDVARRGVGLSSSSERLKLLYGDCARFDAGPAPTGGFVVTMRIPERSAA